MPIFQGTLRLQVAKERKRKDATEYFLRLFAQVTDGYGYVDPVEPRIEPKTPFL